jgi:flagellar protein FliO/FliZ
MLDSLFGAEMPLAVKFFLAFVIVLGAIGVLAWVVRRFGSGRLGGAGSRGRQPRLSVTEYARVDPRRQLILVRRDNVEHLVMIGGPTDLVVEPNIVRAVAAPRDVSLARPPAVEPLPRAIPLPENGNGSWPLAPEPVAPPPAPRAAPKIEPKVEPKIEPKLEPKIEPIAEEPAGWPLQPHAETPPVRPQRDTLAALADELSTPPRPTPPPRNRPLGTPRVPPLGPRVDARAEPRDEPRAEPRLEPRPEPRIPAAQPAAAPATADAGAADQSLAEMAQRLEAALRKSGTLAAAAEPAAPPPPAPPPQSRPARPAEPKPARAENRPNQSTTLIDNLEQEMASLLGRPPNKS